MYGGAPYGSVGYGGGARSTVPGAITPAGIASAQAFGQPTVTTTGIVIDASSPGPAVATSLSNTAVTVTSPSFSPPAGSLLLIGVGNANNNASTVTSITDSLGTHLTYAKKLDSQGIGAQGDSEFWLANVPSTAPGSMTVTATFTAGNNCSVICILVLTGAAPVAGQAGATAKASWNTGGSTTITLTTLKDHSWVFAFTTNANTNTAPTFPGGQTDVFNGHTMLGQHPGAGFECWLHGFTTPTSPAGATSQSVTGTGSAFGSQVAIEVQAAAVAAQNLAPTGIASAQAFGTAVIVARPPPQGVSPAGIASTQAFGTPALAIHLGLHPPGIASAEAFGKSRVQRKRTTTAVLVPAGIVSAQAVGRPTVHPGAVTLSPVGIASAEAVGLGGIGRPFILPKVTGAANLPVMLVRRSGLRH